MSVPFQLYGLIINNNSKILIDLTIPPYLFTNNVPQPGYTIFHRPAAYYTNIISWHFYQFNGNVFTRVKIFTLIIVEFLNTN